MLKPSRNNYKNIVKYGSIVTVREGFPKIVHVCFSERKDSFWAAIQSINNKAVIILATMVGVSIVLNENYRGR
jgi:hypothetical protein